MTTPPTLTARFEKVDSTLRIEYTVFNPGRDAVYLTNHACRFDPSGPVPDHNEAFVFVEDRVVHVTKRIPPPPPAFYNPIPHFVTPLLPGQEFSETIVLELPLQPRVPYRNVQLSGARVQATHAYISVGYKLANPLVEAVQTERAGQDRCPSAPHAREGPAVSPGPVPARRTVPPVASPGADPARPDRHAPDALRPATATARPPDQLQARPGPGRRHADGGLVGGPGPGEGARQRLNPDLRPSTARGDGGVASVGRKTAQALPKRRFCRGGQWMLAAEATGGPGSSEGASSASVARPRLRCRSRVSLLFVLPQHPVSGSLMVMFPSTNGPRPNSTDSAPTPAPSPTPPFVAIPYPNMAPGTASDTTSGGPGIMMGAPLGDKTPAPSVGPSCSWTRGTKPPPRIRNSPSRP